MPVLLKIPVNKQLKLKKNELTLKKLPRYLVCSRHSPKIFFSTTEMGTVLDSVTGSGTSGCWSTCDDMMLLTICDAKMFNTSRCYSYDAVRSLKE